MSSPPRADSRERKDPYVGARPLQESDPLFGRDDDVDNLAELLRSDRIVVLHSPSGAGKSSLINAGLVPRLREQKFGLIKYIRVGGPELLPGYKGGRFLGNLLAQLNFQPPDGVDLNQIGSDEAAAFAAQALYSGSGPFPVLIFDQFEEIATTDRTNTAAVEEFFDRLGLILENRHIWALFAIREDFLGAIEPYVHYIPGALRKRQRLDLLMHDSAVQAISGPVASLHRTIAFDPDAASELARRLRLRRDPRQNALIEGRYVEPVLLQVVCTDIWQSLKPGADLITHDALPDEERLSLALAHFYDRVVKAAATREVGEERIRAWITTQLVEGQLRTQTREGPTGTAADAKVLDKLVDGYVLRRDVRNDIDWYELVHDRMVAAVYESEQQRQLTLPANERILRQRAQEWVDQQRNPFLLLRGTALTEVLRRCPDRSQLSPVEQEYVQASVRERQLRHAERWSTGVAIFAVLLGVVALWWGWRVQAKARQDAEGAAATVVQAEEKVVQAQEEVRKAKEDARLEKERGTLVAQDLVDEARTQREVATLSRLEADEARLLAEDRAAEARASEQRVAALQTETARVRQLAEEEQKALGRRIADANAEIATQHASIDSARHRLNVRDAAVSALQRLGDEPRSGAQNVITAARDALQRSNLIDTYALRNLPDLLQASLHLKTISHRDKGAGVAVASLADAGDRPALRVVTTAGQELTYPLTPEGVSSPRPASCRQYYICVNADGKRQPVVTDCESPLSCSSPLRPVSVAFNGASRTTAVGFYTGNVYVIPRDSDRIMAVPAHRHPAMHLAFRGDGAELASASALWSFAVSKATEPIQRLFRKPSVVRWMQIVLWGGSSEMITSIAYLTPRDHLLAVGFEDGRLEVLDVPSRRAVMRLHAHSGPVLSIEPNRTGTALITASSDGTARVWPVPSEMSQAAPPSRRAVTEKVDTPLHNLGPHSGDVTAAAFHPDGTLAVTAGADSQLQLWDLRDNVLVAVFQGHRSRVRAATFLAPDLLASTSEDGTTRLWRILDRPQLQELRGVSRELTGEADTLAQGLGDRYENVDEAAKARLLDLLARAERLVR